MPLSSLFCVEGKEEKEGDIALLGTLRMPKRNGELSLKADGSSFIINSTR